jgi:single-strand DNA-binding protein
MSTEYQIGLHGRLTRDPELRTTNSGKMVASFGIAENKRIYDKDAGDWKDSDPTFYDCSAFGPMAENIIENLSRGQLVVVAGVHRQRSWQDKDGKNRTSWEVAVDGIGPSLKWKDDGGNRSGGEPPF